MLSPALGLIYTIIYMIPGNPSEPYAITWCAPPEDSGYRWGRCSPQRLWLACSAPSITPVHLWLVFHTVFAFISETITISLDMRSNKHSISIRTRKYQPHCWNYGMDLRDCTENWKTGRTNTFAPDKNWQQQSEDPGGQTVPAVCVSSPGAA